MNISVISGPPQLSDLHIEDCLFLDLTGMDCHSGVTLVRRTRPSAWPSLENEANSAGIPPIKRQELPGLHVVTHQLGVEALTQYKGFSVADTGRWVVHYQRAERQLDGCSIAKRTGFSRECPNLSTRHEEKVLSVSRPSAAAFVVR